jgi:hypothetical protein
MSLLLTDATAQDIQLELIRRHQYNAFDGQTLGTGEAGQAIVSIWWD